MLKAMGIEDEKIDQIIDEHAESVNALKAQRDEFKEAAGKADGYKKELDVNGVGYRVAKEGKKLVMNLGFSHQVNIPDTEDCTIVWQDPNHFSVTGIDKQKVGQYAAEIRAKKPPEPYKGKGIRYAGEVVKHKEGKAGKGKK